MSPTEIDPTALLQPILDGGIHSVNFFNGRMLSGEDLSAEQGANRAERRRLGQTIGDGVAYGLEVIASADRTQPIVSVKPGLALNRRGQTLALSAPVAISLVRPPSGDTAAPAIGFDNCQPLQTGGYNITADGFYLLVLAPAAATEGRAPTSGLGNVASSCNTRYLVEALQFRLVPLDVPVEDVNDRNRQRNSNDRNPARNRVAYRCFGFFPPSIVSPLQGFQRSPFGPDLIASNKELAAIRPDLPAYGLLDDLRPNRLTDCDVPLALIFATSSGIQFVDMWSVRRRITVPSAQGHWAPLLNDRRRAETEAMLLQFQDHLDWGAKQTITLTAASQLAFLPPAGYLPATFSTTAGWQAFLGDHAPPSATEVDEGLLRAILARALTMDPIAVGQAPLVPVEVYRAVSQPNSVLFVRSERGRVRVSFSSAPEADRSVQVYASGPAGTRLATGKGVQRIPIVDIPAGAYRIRALVEGYQHQRVKDVPVRAGQITDVTITLVPLAAATIRLNITDTVTGAALGSAGSGVSAILTQGLNVRTAAPSSGGQLIFDKLAPGAYTIAITALNYQPVDDVTLTVSANQQVDHEVPLTPKPSEDRTPPQCIKVNISAGSRVQVTRLCIAPESIDFTSGRPLKAIPIKEVPEDVAAWLIQWRDWLQREHPEMTNDEPTLEVISQRQTRVFAVFNSRSGPVLAELIVTSKSR